MSNIKKYIEDLSGNIYKMFDNHYLMLSPCKPDEKYVSEMEDDSYRILSCNDAMMIINKQYNALPESWYYEGKHYLANIIDIKTKDDIEEHTIRIRLLPDHSVVLDDEGPSMLKLVRHKGKIYYILLINEKLPRVKAYDLFGRFCQWVGIQYCKPMWCDDDSTFI